MYQETESDRRIDAGALRALVTTIFQACGMRDEDAALLSDSLVEADLRGVHSHGVFRVGDYVNKLTQASPILSPRSSASGTRIWGGVNPRGKPFIARDGGACLVVDGDNSMGQIGATFAMRRVIERAHDMGIAAAAIRGSNHCGAMATFAMQALPHDMIGIATTNALPTMAPWGGAERLLGINPLGVAIPAGQELPIVYDAAFAATAHGKVRVFQQKGLPLPEGWAMDSDGRPTTDAGEAIRGLLMPVGGFKGTGLAMIMGVLSSMLSGAAYGTELGSLESGPAAGKDGHFVMALRIAAFEEVDVFKRRVDDAIRQIHACRRAPDVQRIYAPGELEFITKERYLHAGIPLNAVTRSEINAAAQSFDIHAAATLQM
jgi:LDH2 family malate/lactate/ureidoglycolate dehydrogenase